MLAAGGVVDGLAVDDGGRIELAAALLQIAVERAIAGVTVLLARAIGVAAALADVG